MSRMGMTFQKAISLADELKKIGDTRIYLDDSDPDLPWDLVATLEGGCSYRMGTPVSIQVNAPHPSGLTFTWGIDFEERDANGRGVSLFDRPKLRDVILKLPKPARKFFADFLQHNVLPPLIKNGGELRDAMNKQMDSEDCVRGLIAFGRGE